jgi:hypothetical protein
VAPAAGFLFTRRRIPPELIRERDGLRFTDPALTAIDLADLDCADGIDIALRARAATLAGMHEALRLSRKRRGNFELKLALQIDGRLHETDQDLFESDRWRQSALVGAGWRVLRFTWAMLRDHPEVFVAAVRAEIG